MPPALPPENLPPLPPLAVGFIHRPETGQAASTALVPGATVALVSDRGAGTRQPPPATTERVASGARDWPDSCGKTQLAISLAAEFRDSREAGTVIWVTATSQASVLSAYGEAAAALGLKTPGDAEAVASALLGWLRETDRPWLVVFDDLREAAALDRLWPAGPAGRVLVTTTSAAALPKQPADPVILPVGPFTHRESLAYLMGRLTEDFDQRQGAADLVTELGGEPLALAQAASVIATSELTCRGYLNQFSDQREQVANQGATAAVLTWAMAVQHADVLAEAIAHAQLTFASLLDGNGMPYSAFITAGRRHGVSDSTLAEGLAALEAAGLLSVDRTLDPPLVRASWVVQAAIRAATPEAAIGPVANVAADALLADWPEDDGQPEWLARSFRSTTESLRRVAGDALWQGGCHKLLLRAGRSLDALSADRMAVDYWSDLAAVSDRLLGSDHPDTLAISERLARAYLAAGQPGEAIAWFQWVRGDRASRLGLDSSATADASRDLGKALLAAGRATEAVSALSEAAAGYDHGLGTDSTEAMSVRGDLMTAHRAAGELTTAITVGQRLLSDRERVQGNRHPDTLAAAIQLGEAYVADDRAKAAITLLKRVVADAEKVLGPTGQDTIGARAVLASAYYAAGKMASAIQLYEEVRAQYIVALGSGHRRTLSASLNLVHALYGVGRGTDASKLLRETVDSCEAYLPAGDPLTVTAHESLRNVSGGGGGRDSALTPEPSPAAHSAVAEPDQLAADGPRAFLGRRVAGRHRTNR